MVGLDREKGAFQEVGEVFGCEVDSQEFPAEDSPLQL